MELLANIVMLVCAFAAGWMLRPVPNGDKEWTEGFRAGYAGGQDDAEAVRIHRDADRAYDLGYRDAIRDWTE
jgi:hypothetical protein